MNGATHLGGLDGNYDGHLLDHLIRAQQQVVFPMP